MRDAVLDWFGMGRNGHSLAGHGHHHGHGHDHGEGGHGHSHGVIDPMIATTSRGIWAIKWSFVLLALTAAAQMVIVGLSGSVALVADGYQARTDGFTSLAVVLGAVGVWARFPLADPIVGLLTTAAIFVIVWQSARAVLTRMLDGVEPGILEEIDHAAEHVPGVIGLHAVQARWLGQKLRAELSVHLDGAATVAEAQRIVAEMRAQLFAHLPVLSQVSIRIEAPAMAQVAGMGDHRHPEHGHHHHAPDPIVVTCPPPDGVLEIVDTPEGARMRLTIARHAEGLSAMVIIDRPDGPETLFLLPAPDDHHCLQGTGAPAEPHEFDARLVLQAGGMSVDLPIRMTEPAGHAAH
ncbi:MAG TPA: cation transporter dimerization domain-containing protein [Paracoccaceae bacterium]|nr:cation transporter dimerization domain-containing protein [Paracoccaceae bacterium]